MSQIRPLCQVGVIVPIVRLRPIRPHPLSKVSKPNASLCRRVAASPRRQNRCVHPASSFAQFDKSTKLDMLLLLYSSDKWGYERKYPFRFYQLKVGHGAMGTFLARIDVVETPEWWWCRAVEQTGEDLYARCRKWRKQRRILVRELGKDGVQWRRWGWEKMVSGPARTWKGCGAITKVFEGNRDRRKRMGKGGGSWIWKGRTTKKVKTYLDELRKGKTQNSHHIIWTRWSKIGRNKGHRARFNHVM